MASRAGIVTPEQLAIKAELRALAEGYASGADRRDPDSYVSVFVPDGRLRVYRGDSTEPSSVLVGHEELMRVPAMLAGYAKTFHLLGQSIYEIGDGGATGEVYCMAHHLTAETNGATDYVMHIRYDDIYHPDADGNWKIADRRVNVEWTETRPADPTSR
jgi:hypothetical protein